MEVNGSIEEHGQIRPLYEKPGYAVEVMGSIDAESVESAEHIETELRSVLDKYGVKVKVSPVTVLFEPKTLS